MTSITDLKPAPYILAIHNGLAIYDLAGSESYQSSAAPPLLLMPYPHGYPVVPTAEGPLSRLLTCLGRRVITFDPPGIFRSTRPASVSMPEMLACAHEALQVRHIEGPVDMVGHSMGGLCALAFAIENPERVRSLVLVGSVSGGPSIMRNRGMPLNWKVYQPDFWRFVSMGLRLQWGLGNLAVHKRETLLLNRASFVDQAKAPPIKIREADAHLPAPVRDRWPGVARKLDYGPLLGNVQAPTLLCVGRHDPQAPVGCSRELAEGIPGARLAVFERSGHSPFIEEPDDFARVLTEFWRAQ